ncbi:MAG: response regulator [Planctomycetes bacterium]|nr:response regulator [Planctomycetota bacterium]
MRLQTKLIIAMAVLVLATTAMAGLMSFFSIEATVMPSELGRMLSQSRRMATQLEDYVAAARADMTAMRSVAAVDGLVRAHRAGGVDGRTGLSGQTWRDILTETFRAHVAAKPAFYQLRFIGAENDGRELVRVEHTPTAAEVRVVPEQELQTKGNRPYFRQTLAAPGGNIVVSAVELNEEHGKIEKPLVPIIRLSTPVHAESGEAFGILIVNVDLRPIFDSLRAEAEGGLFLVDGLGNYLIHPDRSREFGGELGTNFNHRTEMAEVSSWSIAQKGVVGEYSGSARVAAAAVPLRLAGGPALTLINTAPRSQLLAPAASVQRSSVIAALIGVVTAFVVAALVAHTLTAPLARITRAVEDYTPGTGLGPLEDGTGEIAVLTRAFRHMAADVKEKTEALKRETEERLKAAELSYAEQQKLSEQLRQAQKMEAIGQLAGGIAHDFNNILTVIIGYADLAREKQSADAEAWAQVGRAGERAAALTRQLLAFSRRQIIAPKTLSLNESIAEMAKMLKRLIGEDVALLSRLTLDPWLVSADPSQVEQVVMNLAVNARDAMPSGGKLTIETANMVLDEEYARTRPGVTPGEYFMLAISDTGIGMDAETQRRLFEPFFTTKGRGRGTGLGLATVYGIVKQNKGHIAAYSEIGKGSTFKIYWPRTTGSVARRTGVIVMDDQPSGTETILLVEDEDQLRDFAADVLRSRGYTVIEAVDGVDALEKAKTVPKFHALVTDVVMPRLGGSELAEQLSARIAGLKVLFTSGYTANAIVHHGVLVEGVNFLAKPYTPAELLKKVRDILGPPGPKGA